MSESAQPRAAMLSPPSTTSACPVTQRFLAEQEGRAARHLPRRGQVRSGQLGLVGLRLGLLVALALVAAAVATRAFTTYRRSL